MSASATGYYATVRASNGLADTKVLVARMWDYAQDYGPKVVWPPADTRNNDEFDPEGLMPAVLQSIEILRITDEPVFHEMQNFCEYFKSATNSLCMTYSCGRFDILHSVLLRLRSNS
jgi:hypothetical protein